MYSRYPHYRRPRAYYRPRSYYGPRPTFGQLAAATLVITGARVALGQVVRIAEEGGQEAGMALGLKRTDSLAFGRIIRNATERALIQKTGLTPLYI